MTSHFYPYNPLPGHVQSCCFMTSNNSFKKEKLDIHQTDQNHLKQLVFGVNDLICNFILNIPSDITEEIYDQPLLQPNSRGPPKFFSFPFGEQSTSKEKTFWAQAKFHLLVSLSRNHHQYLETSSAHTETIHRQEDVVFFF